MGKKRSRLARSLAAMDVWTCLDHKRAREPRYYCPACGMVRSEGSWGETHVLTSISPARVIAHYRHTDTSAKVLCPGGTIDLVEDRAP